MLQFVRLCVDKNLIIDFVLKEELDAFIKPSNTSGSWVRQQIDGVRVKAVDKNGCTIYAIWMRESLMKDYVAYLESIKKTLSDASAFSFPVIWKFVAEWLADWEFSNMFPLYSNVVS